MGGSEIWSRVKPKGFGVMILFAIGLCLLAVALWMALQPAFATVQPSSVRLGHASRACGSVLNPETPAPATWNGGYIPTYHLQSCSAARSSNRQMSVGFGVAAVVMLGGGAVAAGFGLVSGRRRKQG